MAMKRRDVALVPISNITWHRYTGDYVYTNGIIGSQETDSEGTNFPRARAAMKNIKKRPDLWLCSEDARREYLWLRNQDCGSDFSTVTHTYHAPRYWATIVRGKSTNVTHRRYDGPAFAYRNYVGPGHSAWPVVPSFDRYSMIIAGATAIARTLPTNPVAGLAVALAELKQDVPHMLGAALLRNRNFKPRTLAEENLNWQFGVAPTISDIRKLFTAVTGSNKILKQYIRDSDRNIDREYAFPDIETTESTVISSWSSIAPSCDIYTWDQPFGVLTRVRSTKIKTWFTGSYVYHLHLGNEATERLLLFEQLANKLFGVRFDLYARWQLSPWSWLVDWNFNAGDVIHNITALSEDGLVLRRGYVMQSHEITDTYTLAGVSLAGEPSRNLTQSFGTISKQRVKATPYGFGLDPMLFTDRQIGILASLGITRGRGSSRY